MRASKLLEKIQALVAEHGDLVLAFHAGWDA